MKRRRTNKTPMPVDNARIRFNSNTIDNRDANLKDDDSMYPSELDSERRDRSDDLQSPSRRRGNKSINGRMQDHSTLT